MNVTEQNILELTPHIIGLLDSWQLPPEQIAVLLGLEGQLSSRDFRKFRSKSAALPFSEDLAERVEHITGIIEALTTAYPHSREMRVLWLRRPLGRFDKAMPLAVMLNEGIDGLVRVRIEVDCAYGWSLSDTPPGS